MAQLTQLVEIEPIPDTFTPYVDGVLLRAGDMLPAYGAIYTAFLALEAKRFGAEGPGWANLAASTVKKRGSAHPILVDTGELKASLTEPHHANAVFEPGPDEVFMGTSDPVAVFHQQGTHKMPERAVVDISEADAAMFAAIIDAYLFEGLASAGAISGVSGAVSSSVYSPANLGL